MPENPKSPASPPAKGEKLAAPLLNRENFAQALAEAAEQVAPRPEASIAKVTFAKAFTGVLGVWYDRALYNLAEKPEGTAEAAAQELFYNFGTTPEQLRAVSAQLEEDRPVSTSAGELSPSDDTRFLVQQASDYLASFREQHPNLAQFYSGHHGKALPSRGVQGRIARASGGLRRVAAKPVKWGLGKLAKTGVGQAVKKGAAWLAARFGLATIASAVGTPLLGAAVLVVSAVLSFVKRTLRDPVKALIAGGALLLGALLLPLPLIAKLGLFGLGAILGATPLMGSFVGLTAAAGAAFIGFVVMIIPFIAVPLLTALGIAIVVTVVSVFLLVAWFMHTTTAARFLVSGAIPASEATNFDVNKTVVPASEFENSDLPLTLTYTISINPLGGAALTNVRVEERTTVVREENPPSISPRSWTIDSLSSSWNQSYQQEVGVGFSDSLIVNTVSVVAEVSGVGTQQESAVQTVQIGNPPEDCPQGWPTSSGIITQGPWGTFSHDDVDKEEAIDIWVGDRRGVITRATHRGTAYVGYTGEGGNIVNVIGNCRRRSDDQVVEITTLYAHLERVYVGSVGRPQDVALGDIIGTVGDTGNTTGRHLHYEFRRNIPMDQPYIDEHIPYRCDTVDECGVFW